MNTTLALTTVRESIKPPPTKAAILKASAIAISEHRKAELERISGEAQKLEQKKLKLGYKAAKRCQFESVTTVSVWGQSVEVYFKIKQDAVPEIMAIQREIDALLQQRRQIVTCPKEIEKELRGRSVGMDEAVAQLLAAPAVKKKLVEAGLKVLEGVSTTEKEKAITV